MFEPSVSGAAGGVGAQTNSATEIVITPEADRFVYIDSSLPGDALSPHQVIAGINARAGKRNPAPWILAGGAGVAITLSGIPALAIGAAVTAAAAALWSNVRCHRARQTLLTYRLEDNQRQVCGSLENGIRALMSTRGLWRVDADPPSLSGRISAHAGVQSPRHIGSNCPIVGINAGAEAYYFLPDLLLIRTREMFAFSTYADVTVEVKKVPLMETGFAPSDAKIAGRTWKYVKRDGTPDKRYRDNPEFPIVQYAHVLLKADQYRLGLLVSSAESAEAFVAGLRALISGRVAPDTVPPAKPLPTPPQSPLTPRPLAVPTAPSPAGPIPAPSVERQPKRPSGAEWVGVNDSVTVAGFRIPGLVYYGRNLRAINGYDAEPALIDPSKEVAPSTAGFNPESIQYWPSYSSIEPAARHAYLKWQASGRSAADAPISFVFLYFYGLERRVLCDYGSTTERGEEYRLILDEVRRLLSIYGGNSSFRRYATAFLEMAESVSLTLDTDGPPPEYPLLGYEIPSRLKIALGLMARDGKPVAAAWACAWVSADPFFPRRTPFSRCNGYFKELFALRYREKWGVGIVVKPNKTLLCLQYQPASASFGGQVTASTALPDITALKEPIGKLRELGTQCTDELDAYSRYLGRNTGAGAHPAAMALLPAALLAESQTGEARLVRETLAARVNSGAFLSRNELAQLVKMPVDGGFAKREAVTIAQYLASMGIGMEPDIRFGGPVPSAETRVYLFPAKPSAASAPTPAYSAASLLMHLAAMVSAADGTISSAEEEHLQSHVASALHLSEDERTRLSAHLRWVLAERPSVAGAKKRIESLTASQRQAIGRFLVGVANADGHVSPEEVQILGKLYRLLGLDPAAVYSDVHQAATEPVTIQPAAPETGFALPPRKPKPKPATIQLDAAMIEAKLQETAAVSALLASVFVEERSPTPEAMSRAVQVGDSIAGLDIATSAFLRYLSSKPAWSREELEVAAAERALLLDGSIDAINEAAFDACEEPALEGDNPIEINVVVLSVLLERTQTQ